MHCTRARTAGRRSPGARPQEIPMSTVKRLTTLLAVVASMPLVMGAGGNFPPTSGLAIIPSSITAQIILDPHQSTDLPDVNALGTRSGRIGRITLTRKGVGTATEVFAIPSFSSFGS